MVEWAKSGGRRGGSRVVGPTTGAAPIIDGAAPIIDIVGLVPAAGFGRRLPGEAMSKEILPVWRSDRPVVTCLLEAMVRGGASRIHMILRPEKQDVVATLGDGSTWGVDLTYLFTEATWGPALTLDRAYPHVSDACVLLGFPDIVMASPDPFSPLVQGLKTGDCDVLLGLFPPSTRQQADPVVLSAPNSASDNTPVPVAAILPKDVRHDTPWRWGLAAWGPTMTRFLHRQVAKIETERPTGAAEWSVGVLLNQAIEAGLNVGGIPVSETPFLDTGTPEGLAWAREGRTCPKE